LVAHARRADFGFLGLRANHLGRFLPILVARTVPLLTAALLYASLVAIHLPRSLAATLTSALTTNLPPGLPSLGDRLIHQVEDAEVVLGMLEIALRHHAVAATRRVTAQLQVLFEQLLGGAADPYVRPIAVEDVISIEWNPTARVMAYTAATATAATPATTTARTVVAASHAFHVHTVAVVLSRCGAAPLRCGPS
jgi:hypothetical protein